MTASFDVVIPTIGRASLATLVEALAAGAGPLPRALVVVDDRADRRAPLRLPEPAWPTPLEVVASGGRGPAAARNAGARAGASEWIAFLDDDVVPAPDWRARLADDLSSLPREVAGSQGRIRVPRPPGRLPTDAERNVIALESARFATADMAYRRAAFEALGGFDERFRRAYREDTELALRALGAGYRLVRGRRGVTHPLRRGSFWSSVAAQAGNADDALLAALHGPGFRAAVGEGRGRFAAHAATAGAGLVAAAAAAAGARRIAAPAAALYAAATLDFFAARARRGPKTAGELAAMAATSVAIPPAAVFHRLAGRLRARRLRVRPRAARPLRAVLFDRDGTLVADVPGNRDPARVTLLPGARAALGRLRAAGVRLAVVTNQGRVGSGELRLEDVERVNQRVAELLGPFEGFFVCPHAPDAECGCRKPRPGLVERALGALGVAPDEAALVGDTAADLHAARAARVRSILVPNAVTRPTEVRAAPEVALDLESAVQRLLEARR
jgi:histidinol-phosphate phosphatase family protein